jgi:dUTP pyrophosphatase
MSRFVYLAYPIDQAPRAASQVSLFESLEKAKSMLLTAGVDVVFDPGEAFTLRPEAAPGDEVALVNRAAHAQADSVLAVLPAGWATIGVPMEIDRALSQGKWVALCSDANSWMLQDKRKGMARFGLSADDMLAAAEWLASRDHPVYPPRQQDPLPVVVDEGGTLPSRGYEDDAGLDLYAGVDIEIPLGEAVDVPSHVRIQLPPHSWGLIIGRSSTRRKRGLLVHPGVIDTGWRGDLFAMVENVGQEPVVKIKKGDRLAQLIIMNNSTRLYRPEPVDQLDPHPRGVNGFGSTGD